MATALQFGEELTVEYPQEPASARMMARLFFASFWLVTFTGAVRKWLFPGVSVLYLLQDVPIGFAYLYALYTGFFTRGYMMLGILLLSAVLTMQGMIQIIFGGLAPFVAVVGIHHYLFYLPMLLVFPLALTVKYRQQFIRWNLLGSIPMCLLAIVQAQSPTSALVNKTSEGDAFGLPGVDIARVSGTFNFTVFYGLWVATAVACCVGEWLLPPHRRVLKSRWLLVICTFTVNICHLVSGSRSAVALSAAAMAGGAVAAFVLRSYRAMLVVAGVAVLLPVAVGLTYLISPTEYTVMSQRLTGTREVEDSENRIRNGLIGFATIPRFSLLGAGIGMGVDASHVGNTDTYNFTYTLSEHDLTRNVMELGTLVGMPYALIRITFLISMVFFSIWLVRNGCSPHVLPLAFYLLAQSYQGDLTRAATMTSSQVMLGYAFILGVYYHPDNEGTEFAALDSPMRYA